MIKKTDKILISLQENNGDDQNIQLLDPNNPTSNGLFSSNNTYYQFDLRTETFVFNWLAKATFVYGSIINISQTFPNGLDLSILLNWLNGLGIGSFINDATIGIIDWSPNFPPSPGLPFLTNTTLSVIDSHVLAYVSNIKPISYIAYVLINQVSFVGDRNSTLNMQIIGYKGNDLLNAVMAINGVQVFFDSLFTLTLDSDGLGSLQMSFYPGPATYDYLQGEGIINSQSSGGGIGSPDTFSGYTQNAPT